MAAATAIFTVADRPAGYDQTQKRFTLSGTLAITGDYATGGITPNLSTGILQSDGSAYTLPPTYTGANGPGQGVPVSVSVQPVAGYTINYVSGKFLIYSAAGTQLSAATVPAAISAAGIATTITYLRG